MVSMWTKFLRLLFSTCKSLLIEIVTTLQAMYVDVSEKGTTAAGVTAVELSFLSAQEAPQVNTGLLLVNTDHVTWILIG